jgi:pilus assembly protein Flp/PilA
MNTRRKRQEGQGLVEYALILVLVAIVVIAILTLLGPQVSGVFARIMAGFNGQALTGNGLEYAFTSAGVTSPGGGSTCSLQAGATVIALQDGVPVADQSVSVAVAVELGGTALTGTTNRNGIVSMTSGTFNGGCSGTATFSANSPATGTVTKRY